MNSRERNAQYLWDVLTVLGYPPATRVRVCANNWYIGDRVLKKKTAADPAPDHWTPAQKAEFDVLLETYYGPDLGPMVEAWERRTGIEILTTGELLKADALLRTTGGDA